MVLPGIMMEQFDLDPTMFVKDVIDDYVTANPDNCLRAFNGAPIFDKPLVGFANGDDAIFQDSVVTVDVAGDNGVFEAYCRSYNVAPDNQGDIMRGLNGGRLLSV